jgi:hypothetical protein
LSLRRVSQYRLQGALSTMIVIIIKTFTRQRPRVGPPLAPGARLVFNTQGPAVTFAPTHQGSCRERLRGLR